MSTRVRDLLQSQTNAAGANKENSFPEEEMVKRIPMEGTPFYAINYQEKWFVVMGAHRLNELELESEEECWLWLQKNQWTIILRMQLLIINQEKLNK